MPEKWVSSISPSEVPSDKKYSLDYVSYLLLVFGALPGQVLSTSQRGIRVFFNVLNAFGLLIVTARLVTAMSTGWSIYQRDSLRMSIFKVNVILWKVMVCLQMWILTVNSYRRTKCFRTSYVQAVECLESIKVEINWQRGKMVQIIILCVALLLSVGMASVNMSTFDTIDPFFGPLLQNRTTTKVYSALHSFGFSTFIFYCLYGVGYVALFTAKCGSIIILLSSFNKNFSDTLSEPTNGRIIDMKQYRKAHNLLSDVVSEADRMFSLQAGISLLFCCVLLFLVIYIMTSSPSSLAELLSYMIWILACAGTMATIIFVGNIIKDKVSEISLHEQGYVSIDWAVSNSDHLDTFCKYRVATLHHL